MNRLVRSELRKLRSTRTTFLFAVAGIGLGLLLGVANAAIAGTQDAPPLGSAPWVRDVVGVSTIPAAVAALLGVLLAAGEYQHRTITGTFLATPRRARVVVAKVVAMAMAGPALALVMIGTAVLAALPRVVLAGASIDAWHREIGLTVVGLLAASALLGALGVLLGFLVRSQVAAVVAVLAWTLVLEGIVDVLAGGGLRPWLPGGAAADLAGNGDRPLWAAAAILAAWTAALAALVTPIVSRRDVA